MRWTLVLPHVKGLPVCSIPALRAFAAGLRRAYAAVAAAVAQAWSSGQVEGFVNKIKVKKRDT